MASKFGVNYNNAIQAVPSNKVDVSKWGGRMRVMFDSFALSGDLAATDKIFMGKLPKGAIVYDAILAFDDLDAAGGTVDVGYEYADALLVDDPDAFLAAVDVTSAGTVGMIEQNNMVGFGYEVEGDADVIVTVVGDTDAVTGTIKLAIFYALD